jgi:hypothetical protein
MTTTTLKKKIHNYVDASDDRILKVIHTILEEHSKLKATNKSNLSSKDILELDKRWEAYQMGKTKTYSINEASREVTKKLKGIKR